MKNIHILPTDKDSNLFIGDLSNQLHFNYSIEKGNSINQNIYITSSEEIKVGDWVYSKSRNKICKVTEISKWTHKDDYSIDLDNENYFIHHSYCKKIILTTDQDLIKDGVQSIDDDFLEWFVKNPSCESVEIKKEMYMPQSNGKISDGKITHEISLDQSQNTLPYYKIIIPKEEPKQETNLKKHLDSCEEYQGPRRSAIVGKQETLEEAAEKYWSKQPYNEDAFIEGAKWQQERMYSVEDLRYAFECATDLNPSFESFNAWFKQFKKK